jgi:hypothetical protein
MSHAPATAALLVASLFASADGNLEPRALLQGEALHYVTSDASVRSSLSVARSHAEDTRAPGSATRGTVSLHSVTELPSGTRLVEDATTNAAGALVRAVFTFDRGVPAQRTRITLEPTRGVVSLEAPALRVRWQVPTDLAWVWAPLKDPSSHASFATPLQAQVVLRATSGDRPVRMLFIEQLESFTLMADQLVSRERESGRSTVILGNDFADFVDDRPWRVHLAAIGRDLESVDATPVVPIRADNGRAQPSSSFTL